MNASRRRETTGSETKTKDFIIHGTGRILSFMFSLVLAALQVPLGSCGVIQVDSAPRVILHHCRGPQAFKI